MSKVYLVGAGPGDVDLITVKGLKCIQQADVILYDRLVNPELLQFVKSNADVIYCGKLPGDHTMHQETISYSLVHYAKKGKIVVRLKGGDPFVFGRGGEEAEVLVKHGIPFEIVPGITAGIAAPAYAGIPVTHRDCGASFAIVTGHRQDGKADDLKWESLAKGIDTLAIYMGVANLAYIRDKLITFGKATQTPVALIETASLASQRTVVTTLENVVEKAKKEQVTNPCMIVVGEVVKYHHTLNWWKERAKSVPVSEAL
ncbi:uroporphyrinogen-III C-methyltransferase [Bacillus massiliigorillae]|uniref:uroporphyrinogen-III C-methyltransferase n=1 Tax=Bacillus massiliigorillae TaxID=1243664 RepID=UPI0005AA007F|nr:uroporphyrinogen-III C-methyltransferase [Bacillus massiliigorillae]